MNSLPHHRNHSLPERRRQDGAVLVFVMIALVALMLMAGALMRSVDTNTIIAGNLVFRQSAASTGDRGVESAAIWAQRAERLNPAALHNDSPVNGYYSTLGTFDPMSDLPWVDGRSAIARPIAGNNVASVDEGGNEVRYVIERMCREPGAPFKEGCLYNENPHPGGASEEVQINLSKSPAYRVTVRITGPRNTVSFIQGFIY